MRHKIQARAIVYHHVKDAILLVKKRDSKFWHLPGGGQEPGETNQECAVRETLEETGLSIKVERLIYVQELHDDERTIIELFWLTSLTEDQELDASHKDTANEDGGIEESAWFTQEEVQNVVVYPEIVKNRLWADLKGASEADNVFLGVFL